MNDLMELRARVRAQGALLAALVLESLKGDPNKHDRILRLMAATGAIIDTPDDQERACPDPSLTIHLAGGALEALTEMLLVCSTEADEELPFRGLTYIRSDEAWLELRDILQSKQISEEFYRLHAGADILETRELIREHFMRQWSRARSLSEADEAQQ
jgi:hypothetical protein